MRKPFALLFMVFILLTGCGKTGCDLEYFQAISSIEFPEDSYIIDCYDNLEWVVEAVFQLPDTLLEEFIEENEFEALEKNERADTDTFFFLSEKSHQIPDSAVLFPASGTNNGPTNWRYILDLNTGKLWAHINYPDGGGT